MEKKKSSVSSAIGEAGKTAANVFGRAKNKVVSVIDQNDDGQFDLKDVSLIAGALGTSAKKTAQAVKLSATEHAREAELKALAPIFKTDLETETFRFPRLLRIVNMDRRHRESALCTGAVGFTTFLKDDILVNVFQEELEAWGISCYPNFDSEFYYADPCVDRAYIALDDYFTYMKEARLAELQLIAKKLGAKHFRVAYREQKVSFSHSTSKGKVQAKSARKSADAEGVLDSSITDSLAEHIEAEMECAGHEPERPEVKYLKNEKCIQTLISLRMDQKAPLTRQRYTIKFSNSTGMKEKVAIRIDAVLKALKYGGNATVTSEMRNEARRYFEYEIDF